MNEKKKIMIVILGIFAIVAIIIGLYVVTSSQQVGTESSSKKVSTTSTETITKGGTYEITGESQSITIHTTDSVELVLDNATITSENGPAINVESAKEVKVVLKGENTITSTTTELLNGAIYSKADLVFSGDGSLTLSSNYDGIVSKDSLTIKSGTYTIKTDDDGIKGKDSVTIENGEFNITASGDGIQSTNTEESDKGTIIIQNGTFNITSENDGIQAVTNLTISGGTYTIKTTGDTTQSSAKGLKAGTIITIDGGTYDINTTDDGIHSNGNITINNGEMNITSKDDAIHADGKVEVNNGTLTLSAPEGIEGTYVKINDGTINISASDDGINAGKKSTNYDVTVEINGGKITIKMGAGDTDAIDSNGNLYINGGTIDITANSPFDYDGEGKYSGGTLIVNGTETTQLTNQMMGGGGRGGQDPNQNQNGRPNRGYGMR